MKKRKVPFVQAFQMTECGLCCVSMILKYYKSFESIQELRKHLDIGRDGSSMKQLKHLLQQLNFSVKIYKSGINRLKDFNNPIIIFWDRNHFVVLEEIDGKYAYIVDPASGRIKLSIDELEESYSGYLLSPVPNDDFNPHKKENNLWQLIPDIIKKNKVLFLKIFLGSVIIYMFTLGMPILIQNLIDAVSTNSNNYSYKLYLIGMVVFCFLYTTIKYIKDKKLIDLQLIVDKAVGSMLFEKILKVPYKFFDLRNTADIIYTLNTSSVIKDTIANQLINGVIDCGAVIFIFYYMFTQSRILTGLAFVLFFLDIVISLATKPRVLEFNKYLVSEQNKVQAVQLETLNSMLQVKMMGCEKEVIKRWRLKFDSYQNKYRKKELFRIKLQALNFYIEELAPLLILNIGMYLMLRNSTTLGVVIAFYSLSNTFFSLASSIFNTWYQFMNCNIYLERINELVSNKDEVSGSKKLDIQGEIRVENVEFSYYKGSEKVLKNISFTIPKGKKVAIVGKSGSGKSTLAKILIGLYETDKGNVYYDDISVKELDKKYLRRKIGIVSQDITLFNKSIYENIVMDRKDISDEEVIEACKAVQIYDEIEKMPMKFFTYLTEGGDNLSGGQRQRIALARAIVNHPKILLLDEATSSLDNINQKRIAEYLRKSGCTSVIIAHRLTTIEDSDIILVMNNGKIVEKGTNEELIKNKGYYYELYNSENLARC